MASSASTQPPSRRPPLALFLKVVGDDHPKACTGRRLLHLGRARRASGGRREEASPVVLDPYARDPLSGADVGTAEASGVLAVDCSWNRLSDRGGFEEGDRARVSGRHRRLPYLLAANPQHYGRLGELNTVEALSAAVYLLGRPQEASDLLEGFRGGPEFLKVNLVRLEAYRDAGDPDAVREVERRLFGRPDPVPGVGGAEVTRSGAPRAPARRR